MENFPLWYNIFAMDTGLNELQAKPTQSSSDPHALRKQRLTIVGIILLGIIILGILVTGLVFLISPGLTSIETVSRLRDIFIILMALESLLIGLALTILIIQIARLTNLLENEVKPILDSTNETISNLRGTTKFLSDNLVKPVIKFNEVIAVFQRVTDILKFTRKR
jgi:glycyl-tRNA synthetase beta subunit